MSEMLVKAEGVCVRRGGADILTGINLEVAEGDFISVVGPNGAGKTTLMKVMAGVMRPDGGRCGRKRGLKTGYVPQRLDSLDYMPISAGGFIRLRRGSAPDIQTVCRETGIGGILDSPMSGLSGGEIQRVLLARALLGEPELLILDEPAQNLDVSGQLEFYGILDAVRGRLGAAVLMVSHDLHMVMSSTKKVVCLYRHICCEGEPSRVAKDPEFASMFGAETARLMSVYAHEHKHTHGADTHGADTRGSGV